MPRNNNLHESSLSRARQSVRTRFSTTVDDPRTTTASIYKTAKESLAIDNKLCDAILDPRVLYRAKKSTATAANTAFDIIKLQAPGPPTLAHKKLSMFHTKLAQGHTQRLGGAQRINLHPIRNTAISGPRKQLMRGRPDALQKRIDEMNLGSVTSPLARGSTANIKGTIKMSQTLMSHHNRKQTALLKDSFPQVHQSLNQTQTSFVKTAAATTIADHQSDFGGDALHPRRNIAIMADTQRSYDPIMRAGHDTLRIPPNLPQQSIVAQKTNQTLLNDGRAHGRNLMNKTMPIGGIWHQDVTQATGTATFNTIQNAVNQAAVIEVPKTSAQPQRKLQSIARQRHSLVVNGDNTTADNTTSNTKQINKEIGVRQLFNTAKASATELRGGLINQSMGVTRQNPHQTSQQSITKEGRKRMMHLSLLTPEQESAVFMSRPSNPNISTNQQPDTPLIIPKHTNKMDSTAMPDKISEQHIKQWPNGGRNQLIKKHFGSSNAVVEGVESRRKLGNVQNMVTTELKASRHTPPLLHKQAKLDISPVPMAIASKQSKVSINVSRKNSSNMLVNDKSFIDMTNASKDKVNRNKQLGQGLFNDDLREVTIQKGHKANSHLRLSKDDQSQLPYSTFRPLMDQNLEIDGDNQMALFTPQMMLDMSPVQQSPRQGKGNITPPLYQQATQIQFPIDRCNWIISNETLSRGEMQGTQHILTKESCSNETFQQKMQENKPPRLDQIVTRPGNKPTKTLALRESQVKQQQDQRLLTIKSKSPNRNAYGRQPHYMAAPMIITNKYAFINVTAKDTPDVPKPTQQKPKASGFNALSYNHNNSIIIDCNSLVSDTDKEHLLRPARANKIHNESITTNIGKSPSPMEQQRDQTTQSVLTQLATKTETVSKTNPKTTPSKLLGNPLLMSQLVGPQGKRSQNMSQPATTRESQTKLKDNQNKDITQVTGPSGGGAKDAGIGVGSVVLHLRKQRLPKSASNEGGIEADDTRIAVQTLYSDDLVNEDILAGIAERDLGTAHITSSAEQIDGGVLLSKKPKHDNNNNDLGLENTPQRKNDREAAGSSSKRAMPNGKNTNVLRQKPFTSHVKTDKVLTVAANSTSAQKKMGSPCAQNRFKHQGKLKGQLPQLELVGTHKEQFMQLPRLQKYDVKNSKRSPRGGFVSTARANFFIPHYKYFGNSAQPILDQSVYQEVTPETFGETIEPGQMHQLITLQNGQMMIRRVNMSIEAAVGGNLGSATNVQNVMSIDLSNIVPENGTNTTVTTAHAQQRSNLHMISVQQQQMLNDTPGLMQSPTTRLMDHREIRTPDGVLTPPIMSSGAKRSAPDQQTLNQIKFALQNRDKISVGAETMSLGVTEVSNSSIPHMLVDENQQQYQRVQFPVRVSDAMPMRLDEDVGGQAIQDISQASEQSSSDDHEKPRLTFAKAPPKKRETAPAVSPYIDQQELLRIHPLGQQPYDTNLSDNSQSRISEVSSPDIRNMKLIQPDNFDYPASPSLPSNQQATFKLDTGHSLQTRYNQSGEQNGMKSSQQSTSSKRVCYYKRGDSGKKGAKPLVQKVRMTNASLIGSNETEGVPMLAKMNPQNIDYSNPNLINMIGSMSQTKDVGVKSILMLQQPCEEDPIVRAKKINKKNQMNQSRQDSKNTDLQPWDDKPDICLQQKRNTNKRRGQFKNEGNVQSKTLQLTESSVDRKKMTQIVTTSVNSLNSQVHNSIEKNVSSSPTRTVNGRPKHEPLVSRLRSKNNAMLLVNDKARESIRETQEREMNSIVFEDSTSPHFRLRNDSSEDKTLEQLVRKPEDATDDQISGKAGIASRSRGGQGGSGDDQDAYRSEEEGSNKNLVDEEEIGAVDGSPGEKSNEDQQAGLSEITKCIGRPVEAKGPEINVSEGNFFLDDDEQYEDEETRLRQEARGAVLMRNNRELKALRTTEIHLRDDNSTSEEYIDEAEVDALLATKESIEKGKNGGKGGAKIAPAEHEAVETNSSPDDEFEKKYAQYGKLLRGKGWKAPMPQGMQNAAFVHINDSHLDSYFQQSEQQ